MINGKFEVIDSHCHVYPAKIASAAVGATDAFYGVKSEFDGSVETLLKQMQESGVDRAIIQSVATTPHQVASINRFIAQTVSENPDVFTGLGTLHPESEDIEGDIENLVSLGLKGVKLHPDIQKFKLDDYRCLKIYEICERLGLVMLLHTGDKRYDYSNPNRLLPILETYTDLTVIGGHLGGYSVWDEAAEKLSGHKNFYVDTSSSMAFIGAEKAKRLIEIFSPDQVLFATDYPMYAQKTESANILSMGFRDEDLEKIFSENAKKVFSL